MPVMETYRGVVFPWLGDHMGHMNTSKYFEMFDVAFYHLAHRLGLRLGNDASSGMGLADVRHEIDYKREVRIGSLVLIRSGMLSIGRSSFKSRHVMTDADGNIEHAILTATTVQFDLKARKAVPLPGDFAQRAAPLMIAESSQ